MRRITRHALMGLLLLALAPLAPAQLPAVTGLQPLLIAAIRDGYAEGAYQSPASRAFFEREFATRSPVEYRVKRIEAIEGQGACARLSVTASQRGVIDRNESERASAPQDLAVTWQIAYCAAGHYAGERQ